MRLCRLLLTFAAAAALAACNPQSTDKGAARAPIPPAQSTGPSAAAEPACPPVPACPPAKASKARSGKVKAAWAASHRRAVVHRAVAQPRHRTYRRYEALAGGPPSHREYARVPQDDYGYEDGAATTYRYGPAYPPAWRPEEREGIWRRYEAPPEPYRYHREEQRRGAEVYERALPPPPPPPPPVDRYGPDRSSRYEGGSSYSERYSSRDHDEARRPPPPVDRYSERRADGYEARRGYDDRAESYRERRTYDDREEAYKERRAYEGRSSRYEARREESSSTYESESRTSAGPCCRSEAAGFDANGFLTWPGKVPARP
jgi:hypothetical protein